MLPSGFECFSSVSLLSSASPRRKPRARILQLRNSWSGSLSRSRTVAAEAPFPERCADAYIQELSPDADAAEPGVRDHYFLGRLDLAKGLNFVTTGGA